MLRFFRQIRKKLMEHPSKSRTGNKIRTYLLYAVGEIALVMIGILLALQVNNWNNQSKEAKQEKRIHEQLQSEIQNTIESRTVIKERYEEVRKGIRSSLDIIFNSDNGNKLNEEQCRAVFASHIISWDNTSLATVDELISTGTISLIKNEELRLKLLKYRNQVSYNNQVIESVSQSANVLVDMYPDLIERIWVIEEGESRFECNVGKMRLNKSFMNQLQSNYGRLSTLNSASEDIILLNEIQKYINDINL